jgi:predicted glycosyltransferase
MEGYKAKIWIDLDNSPHVPFFAPIIAELERRGYRVWVSARDRFQVDQLASMHNISHVMVGRDYQKNKIIKVWGLLYRALQLLPLVWQEKPSLALSHGSRSQVIAATMAGIPQVVMIDYEFVSLSFPFFRIDNIFMPDAIPEASVRGKCRHIWRYPGIKEDVYVPRFKPSKDILDKLAISPDKILVTVRPPANNAHYHTAKSEELFREVIPFVAAAPNTVMVMLPRNEKQGREIGERWPRLLQEGKVIIPDTALDGLDLAWHSDLVISGGGTMIREAAALGVPAYSIFGGETGCVDRYLAETGRLKLINSSADLPATIKLEKRTQLGGPVCSDRTLNSIVDELEQVVKQQK